MSTCAASGNLPPSVFAGTILKWDEIQYKDGKSIIIVDSLLCFRVGGVQARLHRSSLAKWNSMCRHLNSSANEIINAK